MCSLAVVRVPLVPILRVRHGDLWPPRHAGLLELAERGGDHRIELREVDGAVVISAASTIWF
jgi:hypothetical protein